MRVGNTGKNTGTKTAGRKRKHGFGAGSRLSAPFPLYCLED